MIEALLVNTWTNEALAWNRTALFLAVVFVLHMGTLAALLRVENPLPQFSSDLYAREADLQQAREDLREAQETAQRKEQSLESALQTFESDFATYVSVVLATTESLAKIEDMQREPVVKAEEAFEATLAHWIDHRKVIFRFGDGDPLYNFAVYLMKDGLLRPVFRDADRRIRRNNREWKPDEGHVGYCFHHGRTIVPPSSGDVTTSEQQYIQTSEEFRKPKDDEYYKSFAATPIKVDKEKRGVFVVTSSNAGQFELKFHRPIMDVLGILLAQALESCQEER